MLLEIFQAVTGIFQVIYDGQHALRFERSAPALSTGRTLERHDRALLGERAGERFVLDGARKTRHGHPG